MPALSRSREINRCTRFSLLLTLAIAGRAQVAVCARCHPAEVAGYSQFSMAHSLRRASREPAGSFQNAWGTKFTVRSDESGTWQRLERTVDVSEYRVEYVIGSGNHASGYLVRIGDHLFQSPIAYYTNRRSYDMAPGYEKASEADFTRPVTEECLLCHSGKPLHLAGTVNRYASPPFEKEAISCERCHGSTVEHLKRPVPGSIINPARLSGAARDSVCEQCHLSGFVRVLNPGKSFADFRPGQRLEEVFTVYRDARPPDGPPGPLKVISHPEQLAASACARNSNGKMWCGTCHDPHNKPAQPIEYYRTRCLSCHAGKLIEKHPEGEAGDCVGCHMPRRKAFDGGHTVFTDHRIVRRPQTEAAVADSGELVAWREPDAPFAKRNLALAYVNAGLQKHSPAWIVRGYRMLSEIQTAFADDAAVLNGFGAALLEGNRPCEARFAFNRLVTLDPSNPLNQENAGRAELGCGDVQLAVSHLEKAMELDPLLLSAAELLESIYGKTGETAKQAALAARVEQAMRQPH